MSLNRAKSEGDEGSWFKFHFALDGYANVNEAIQ